MLYNMILFISISVRNCQLEIFPIHLASLCFGTYCGIDREDGFVVKGRKLDREHT